MRHSLLLVLFLLAWAGAAHAQFPAEVRGRVTDATTGAAVAGARVEVPGSGAASVTGADGSFRLRGLVPGRRELHVSAFGFREQVLPVEVENGRSLWIVAELEPEPLAVGGLVARGVREEDTGALSISREEIEASGARELGELLRDRAGVTVTRRGGPGSPAEVSIRGSGADQVLVLLDGSPINSLLTGAADLSTVPLEAVERVIVLRGAQSARYGGGALAGVIAVETRRPTSTELGGRLRAGAWGERAAALSAGGQRTLGRYTAGGLLSGEWQSVRGDFPFSVPEIRGGGEAVRDNADTSLRSMLATGRLETPGPEIGLRFEALSLERGMPGSIVQPSLLARQEQERLSGSLNARGASGVLRWRAGIDAQQQEADYRDPSPPHGPAYDDRVDVGGVTASASIAADLGALSLAGGFEARELRFSSTMLAEGAPRRQSLRGAHGHARWTRPIGEERMLEIHSGFRADRGTLLDGSVLSPRVGASMGGSRLSVRMSAGNAFSPPSLSDQFFQEGVLTRPNPDLRPERVRGEVEIGAEIRALEVGDATLDLEAAAYRADIDGMILWFPDHRFVWRPDNFDVRRRGAETSARLHILRLQAELWSNASYVRNEYASPALPGPVVYRPSLTAAGGGAFTVRRVRGELSARYVGERRTVPGSALNVLAPYWLAGLHLSRPFTLGRWSGEASLAVENLLDREAAMLIDYPYPGRSWSLALRIRHQPRRGVNPGTPDSF